MKNKFKLCLLGIISLSASIGITTFSTAKDQDGKPDLFEVSDGDSSIFIFGTIHILPPRLEWQKPILKDQIQQADSIYFELDQDDPDFQANMQKIIFKYMAAPIDIKLSEELTSNELEMLDSLLKPLGIQKTMYDTIPPWILTLQVSVGALVKNGYNPAYGVEQILMAHVKDAGKDIQGLETAESQISIFGDIPPKEQVELLKANIAQLDDFPTMVDGMVSEWKDDNLTELAVIINKASETSEEFYYKLIDKRNLVWVDKFKKMLENNEQAFIAVGAGHLAGKVGVLTLLEESGYTVKRH